MNTTIQAVAEAAGVSKTTVSFVLNNRHPQVRAIPKETRERIRRCAAELGYRKNPIAASLRTGKPLWIGVMMEIKEEENLNWMWSPFFEMALLGGVQKTLSEQGYFTLLGAQSSTDDHESLDSLASAGLGGLILKSPRGESLRRAQEMMDSGLPLVAVFPVHKEDLYPNTVDLDNKTAGNRVAELLMFAKRRSPMYILNEDATPSELLRCEGFKEIYEQQYGIEPACCLLPKDANENQRIQMIADAVIKHKPDGIMATETANSFQTSYALGKTSYSVPNDVAIIGFDCFSFRSADNVRMSAMGVSWWHAGRSAAEMLLEIVHNDNKPLEPCSLEPRFIPGDTTPPILEQMASPRYIGEPMWL